MVSSVLSLFHIVSRPLTPQHLYAIHAMPSWIPAATHDGKNKDNYRAWLAITLCTLSKMCVVPLMESGSVSNEQAGNEKKQNINGSVHRCGEGMTFCTGSMCDAAAAISRACSRKGSVLAVCGCHACTWARKSPMLLHLLHIFRIKHRLSFGFEQFWVCGLQYYCLHRSACTLNIYTQRLYTWHSLCV